MMAWVQTSGLTECKAAYCTLLLHRACCYIYLIQNQLIHFLFNTQIYSHLKHQNCFLKQIIKTLHVSVTTA
jgi:hypothetical protein